MGAGAGVVRGRSRGAGVGAGLGGRGGRQGWGQEWWAGVGGWVTKLLLWKDFKKVEIGQVLV